MCWNRLSLPRKLQSPKRPTPVPRTSRLTLWICLALAAVTLAVYAQVSHFSFVNFDDPDYVANNPHVREGLSADGVRWAFTSGDAANWFPLTWISHMMDCQLFGLNSGWHHVTNAVLHAIAVILLFLFLNRATRAPWPSAFVAAIFALHPLHVESVAWIAERKDVLSAVFWFAALYWYVRYETGGARRDYWMVVACFVLGLMAKPMIVTLPFVLLLVDVWPLRRRPAVGEKIPLFVISAIGAAVTFFVQRASGAVQQFGALPLGMRAENALDSYGVYLWKTVWPSGLAVFYPYPRTIPLWQPVAAAAVLIAITVAAAAVRRTRPYLLIGWLWFLGTLVPVIGLVQVGPQAHADRYMYVPMVGLLIMLAWAGWEVAARRAIGIVAAVLCAICIPVTAAQIGYWANSNALFQHALDVTDDNYLAHHNLAVELLNVPGRNGDALAHLEAAVRIEPNSGKAYSDLGNALSQIPGREDEAIAAYRQAIRLLPGAAIPHNNLANTLARTPGRMAEAIAEYQTALRLDPNYEDARKNLAAAQRPDSAEEHFQRGVALAKTPGQQAAAKQQFEAALRINPNYADAHSHLGVLLAADSAHVDEAIRHFEAALRIQPNDADAHVNLAIALSQIPGKMPEAIRHLEQAQRIHPDPEVQQMLDRLRH